MKYIAVDIGCIECGEGSALIGVYDERPLAVAAAEAYMNDGSGNDWGRAEWHGQHSWDVFEWEDTRG